MPDLPYARLFKQNAPERLVIVICGGEYNRDAVSTGVTSRKRHEADRRPPPTGHRPTPTGRSAAAAALCS
jgi:hypothetical protein